MSIENILALKYEISRLEDEMYKLEGVKDENIIMDMEIKRLDQGLIQERSKVIHLICQ